MRGKRVLMMFLILFIVVPFVWAGDPQTTSPQQASQTPEDKLAECEANLSILQQQLMELNRTLENITRERDYYKGLYENMTVNVTNFELIQIKQNITVLNQRIQQLNSSIRYHLENIENKLYIRLLGVSISIDTLLGFTLLGNLIGFTVLWKQNKKSKGREENKKEVPDKNEVKPVENSNEKT
ncbi:hypothetical protein APY94_00065 [Thermococcus celericrescens]|uniref:Uncharacterized protein n=1 Tax=Thermococcus celericrescens TaxID=227598 RepID=A0A124EBP4_9EURY|nr:hypothetical protein [Thermococcus celericrescens]KUH34807.1 hypothetical protein APY94_00065 [Thermococcus celericrescens]